MLDDEGLKLKQKRYYDDEGLLHKHDIQEAAYLEKRDKEGAYIYGPRYLDIISHALR